MPEIYVGCSLESTDIAKTVQQPPYEGHHRKGRAWGLCLGLDPAGLRPPRDSSRIAVVYRTV
jgi:hypothetical protein